MKRTVLEVHLNDTETTLQVFDYLDKMGFTWVCGHRPKQDMYDTMFRWDDAKCDYVLLKDVAVYLNMDAQEISWCYYGYNNNRDLITFLEDYEFLYSVVKKVIILNGGDV